MALDICTMHLGYTQLGSRIRSRGHTVHAPHPCAFRAELLGLLGEPPAGGAKLDANALAERLNQLEGDARRHDASTTTIAAIMTARAMLRLAEALVVFVAYSRRAR